MMIKIFLIFGFFIFLLTAFFDFQSAINAVLGYFCASFIIFISYKIYKNKILIQSDEFVDDENLSKKNRFIFFAPLKILSYIVLIATMFLLKEFKIFSPMFFILGIFCVILVAVFYAKFNANLKNFFAKF